MTGIVYTNQGQRMQKKNTKGKVMKNYLFIVFCALFAINTATAGFAYTETETITTFERINIDTPCGCERRFASSQTVKPCAKRTVATQPVRVKTHTEIIDHYQVYQPVTVYKPMGTEIHRRIVK